jgi:integrase
MANATDALAPPTAIRLRRESARVIEALERDGLLSAQSLPRTSELIRQFCSYSETGLALSSLEEIEPGHAAGFVRAPTALGDPAPATMHLRRSGLRLLFRTARQLGLAESDPTLDLVLPPRSNLKTRPLSTDEVELCRACSLHTLTSTRLPAAWALAESSARSAEIGRVRVADVDLVTSHLWLPGSRRTVARSVPISEWARTQLERRIRALDADPNTPLVYEGAEGSDYHRQAAACVAIGDTLRRAGLGAEPDVRPSSVAAWAGWQVHEETGRIEESARRLGVRSLDRAARMIEWDWTDTSTDLACR